MADAAVAPVEEDEPIVGATHVARVEVSVDERVRDPARRHLVEPCRKVAHECLEGAYVGRRRARVRCAPRRPRRAPRAAAAASRARRARGAPRYVTTSPPGARRGSRPCAGGRRPSRRSGPRRRLRRGAPAVRLVRSPEAPIPGASRSSTPPSWAKNGGTTLSQAAPPSTGRRQRLDRFQVRICRASAIRGVPRPSSAASAHARSAAGPPGQAQGMRSGSSSVGSPLHGLSATRGARETSARYVTCPPAVPDAVGVPSRRRSTVTSSPCAARAPSTTGHASCHHGNSTSNGGSDPRTTPSGRQRTSVT